MYNNQQKDIEENLPHMPDLSQLNEILNIQSSSKNESRMVVHLWDKLKKYNPVIDNVGNMIITKGESDAFPCVVAHLDTVHNFYNDFKVSYTNKLNRVHAFATSQSQRVGVGGDDKCGIFACLYMLEKFDNIKIVFFTQEESGLIGSSDIEESVFDDVGYIIQLDRWGRSDFISSVYKSDTVSDSFKLKIKDSMFKYGFYHAEGLITDSINLFERNVGVSCVNISCGYYQHHSNMEYIDVNELWNSVLFTEQIIRDLGEEIYAKYGFNSYNELGYYDKTGNYYDEIENYYDCGNKWNDNNAIEDIIFDFLIKYDIDINNITKDDRELLSEILKDRGIHLSDNMLYNYTVNVVWDMRNI
jgi:hypothetical protein